jgi:4,5-DOPA dioxygenase extradiol
MTTRTKAPVLFVSHGAPTFAIEPGVLGPKLQDLGSQLTGIKAVLVVSPHWQTRGVRVSTDASPETIHDFGGFPSRLYDLQYTTAADRGRGLDHGAWVPLMHLLPQAKVPVFQVSMPFDLTAEQAVAFGRTLAPLREQGVLILASGSMTHNLREFRQGVAEGDHYVQEFSNWVITAVRANAVPAVVRYRTEAPHAERAHPSEEHFLPLLIAMGAQLDGESATLIDGGIEHGMLSMASFVWGLPLTAH